ncbi:putative histidine kinase/HSP90-like ATPase, morc, S5 domain 2 [Helianthus annuus]|nr:putative histidine kinase/HSP90-like ATPase, morc, S5 domain 2 [Helianthus annuus]
MKELLSGNVYANMDASGVKLEPDILSVSSQLKQSHTIISIGRRFEKQEQSAADAANFCSTSPVCEAPIIRQFWKAGVYNDELASKPTTQSGSTYLHIHPRFLHSNATSHKWVFGAVAELIDNAVDEIQNGATFVVIDKYMNPRNGSSALLIQDDGNGMDPESMRRCLSFGFSDKSSISAIGKYGNGFKTSTMRLGADVIVFSRNITNSKVTQSIGLLSYTFLTREGYDRIVVPMVHYEFNFVTNSFVSLQAKDNEYPNLNMSMLLKWSPYSTEEELLKQFENVGPHGTKIIIYNLWLDEDRGMELDFDSDPEDICITRIASNKLKDGSRQATSGHLANRLRYSLRAYLSILYLKLPETFAMVLRGKVVLYHNVATDLKYTEFIMYKPLEGSVVTTIGFLKEAPHINVHGFNVYHKNRLILPFWPVVSYSSNRGRCVVGILEANFIEPTHDKQDFEKTSVYQKLVHRLKEMTLEYWDYHCGLIGYQIHRKPRPPSATPGATNFVHQHGPEQPALSRIYKHTAGGDKTKIPPMITTINSRASFQSNLLPNIVQQPSFPPGFQQGSNLKRKLSELPMMFKSEARMEENRKLRAKCSEFEKAEERLKLKVIQLKMELGEAQKEYVRLLDELQCLEKVKCETSFQYI